jgi:hypothetical protein
VSQAKGPAEWPHSLRATRVKLIELSRQRAAAEDAALDRRKQAADENDEFACYADGDSSDMGSNHGKKALGLGAGIRRPLYRQSSMDFLNSSAPNFKDNDSITRYVV